MYNLFIRLFEACLKRIESSSNYENILRLSSLLRTYANRYDEEISSREYKKYLKRKELASDR
jgi:hypothetical protein